MTSNDLLAWLVEASIILGAVTLLVFLIGRLARNRVGAVWIYALWLTIPAALAATLAPGDLFQSPVSLIVAPDAAGVFAPAASGPSGGAPARAFGTDAVLAVWLLGAVVLLLHLWRAQHRFMRTVAAASRSPAPAEARDLAMAAAGTRLDPKRDIRFSAILQSPLACGLLRPLVLLPEQFLTRYTAEERRVIVLHEAEHIRARHLQHRIAAAGLRCLFWFHPLAWLGERAFLADQEMACDHAVLRRDAAIRPRRYAATLLKAAGDTGGAQPRPPAASVPLIAANHLKERTVMLSRYASLENTRMAGLFMVTAVTSVAVLAGLFAVAPARAQTEHVATFTNRLTGPDSPPLPPYPEEAVRDHREGECIIGFDIAADGTTENVHSLGCTDDIFEVPALRWMRAQQRYDPETRGGARDQRVVIIFQMGPRDETETGAEGD